MTEPRPGADSAANAHEAAGREPEACPPQKRTLLAWCHALDGVFWRAIENSREGK